MATPPIISRSSAPAAVPPLKQAQPSPPGQPDGMRQRLSVSGQPQAEARRSPQASGRVPQPSSVPVSVTTPSSEVVSALEDIDEQVKQSYEYRLLQRLLGGDDVEAKPVTDAPPESQEAIATESVEVSISVVSWQRLEVRWQSPVPQEQPPRRSDPIAFDLDGNGLQTTGIKQGVRFDINADGRLDQTSFVSGNDAFLALDRNGNGRIDDGGELFGDQHGAVNGFEELAKFDDNADGMIDDSDRVFQHLRLLRLDDQGKQHISGMADAAIQSIELNYRNTNHALNQYDRIEQLGSFVRDDGSRGETGDLLLGYRS